MPEMRSKNEPDMVNEILIRYGVNLLRPESKDGKKGFMDIDGRRVIEPVYDDVDVFREGVAWVKVGDCWGLIDRQGKMLIEPQYEAVREFNDGLANVRVNGLWCVMDKCGNIVVRPEDAVDKGIRQADEFSQTEPGAETEAEAEAYPDDDFCYEDDPSLRDPAIRVLHGYINRRGDYQIKPKFQEAGRFSNGLATVRIDNKYGIIDRSGAYIIEPGDKAVVDSAVDLIKSLKREGASRRSVSRKFVSVKRDGRYGVETVDGKTIVEPVYDDIQFTDEGVFIVGVKEEKEEPGIQFLPFNTVYKYGLIDLDGNLIVPPSYAYDDNHRGVNRMEFHEGLAAVCVNDKWGYINARGEMVIEPQFEKADNFSHGVAYIREGGLYGLIDRSGKVIVAPQFANISSEIKNGYIRVENEDHRWGVIDTSGRMVVSPEHEYVFGDCSEGMVRIQHDERFGYADCRTGDIIQPVYDYVWEFSEGLGAVRLRESQIEETPSLARASFLGNFLRAESGGKYGFVNQKGQWVIEPKFDDAKPEFTNGVVFVKEGDKWGLIDMTGRYVVPPTYDDKGSEDYRFVNDRSTVYINGEKKIIDSKGCFYIISQPSEAAQSSSADASQSSSAEAASSSMAEASPSADDDFPF